MRIIFTDTAFTCQYCVLISNTVQARGMSGYCSLIAAWYCVPSDQKRVSPPTFLPPAITGERKIIIIIIIIGILIVLTNTG